MQAEHQFSAGCYFYTQNQKGWYIMAKKRIGELPSGSIRKKVYSHTELCFDKAGNPIIDKKTGKPKQKKVYVSITGTSSADVNRKVAEFKQNKKIHKQSHDLTLYEAIDKYILTSDAVLSPSTIRGYRTIQRNAFKSIISKKLADLNLEVLRAAVNEESKRKTQKKNTPISAKTVHNEYGLIVSVLNVYAPSVETNVTLPQVSTEIHELSTPDVIFKLVKGTNIELPVLLAMWLSFTASEIVGLTKSKSISSDGNFITIKEVIVTDEHNKSIVKNKGKQPKRNRTLRIPEYIKNLIDQVETDRLVPITVNALSKRWAKIVKNSDIPKMTFHDLRHVNASVMTLLRIPDKYAQDRGGWKSDHIMKSRYQQTFSEKRMAVDQKIDEYMTDSLFGDTLEKKMEKKYRAWLELFSLNDTKESMDAFKTFCSEHDIEPKSIPRNIP